MKTRMSRSWQSAGLMGLGLACVTGGTAVLSVHAEEQPAANVSQAPAAAQPSGKAAKQANAVAQLNGTEWNIELTSMSGKAAKHPLKDTLKFTQGKIESSKLVAESFMASNYTVTVGDDEIPVWETMQTSTEKGTAFWRGELHQDTMSGVLSKHPLKGEAEDYSFVGHPAGTVSAAEPASMPSAAPAPSAATPPVATASPKAATAKSEKAQKGWFGF